MRFVKQAQLIKLDNLILGIDQILPISEDKELELYFYLPKEMKIGPETLAEEQVFYRSIQGTRYYSSAEHHLSNIKAKLSKLMQRKGEDYKLHLNLMVYQIIAAIANDVALLRRDTETKTVNDEERHQCAIIKAVLNQFRTLRPEDERQVSYFALADNYLSWFCEQTLLKLVAEQLLDNDYDDIKREILTFCRQENEYRTVQKYNTKKTLKNPNRIANKMVLLQRVVQQGVVLKEKIAVLGLGLKRLTTGLAMALVMMFITVLVLQAKDEFSNLTIAFVISMALIYGLREIFKDDVKKVLWRRVQKGRPKWRRELIDTTSKKTMVHEKIWLEYLHKKDVPEVVSSILNARQRQNRIESQVLFYRLKSHVKAEHFPDGYQEIKEQVQFSLLPFTQYLHKGKAKIYSEQFGQIATETVERRYQVNLVMAEKHNGSEKTYRRFKITLNRERIVNITEAELEDSKK